MNFTAFHLMPFDGLTEDFTKTHRSVWVDIPPEVMDVRRMHVLYNDYLDELEFAARSGFHAIGVNEHHNSAYGMMSSPNMMATSLARRTADTDAKLLVMGDAVPLYNPPIRIAEELAMLDVISGGRLITGFPLGSSQDTNFGYGIPPATTREQHAEGFDLILKAWTTNEVFAHNGRFSKLRYVNPWPKPLQDPHPPIWIPGSGSVETMDFALERDFPYFFLSYFGAEYADTMLQKFWARAEAAGRDDNPHRVGMFQIVLVADSDAEAERLYAEHVKYFYQRCVHIYPGFIEAPGYKTVESLREVLPAPGAASSKRPDSFAAAQSYEWGDFIDNGIIIAGGPDTVRDRLAEAAKRSRIGNWITLVQVGDMPRDKTMHSIDLMANKVIPSLEGMFSEYDDPWWPAPVADFEPTPVAPVAWEAR